MGVEWVCFGRGHFVPEILQKKVGTYVINAFTYVYTLHR